MTAVVDKSSVSVYRSCSSNPYMHYIYPSLLAQPLEFKYLATSSQRQSSPHRALFFHHSFHIRHMHNNVSSCPLPNFCFPMSTDLLRYHIFPQLQMQGSLCRRLFFIFSAFPLPRAYSPLIINPSLSICSPS